jgi:hypothetical protein
MNDFEVFLVDTEPNNCAWLEVPNGDEGLLLVGFFDGTGAIRRWRPVHVEILVVEEEGKERTLGDVAYFRSGSPALSPKACQALARYLVPNDELLPLRSRDPQLDGWCVFNTTTVVDALDEEHSLVERIPSGKVYDVRRHEFHGERLPAAVFQVPQMIRSQLYCLRALIDEVERAGLRGLGFKKVWSSTIQ